MTERRKQHTGWLLGLLLVGPFMAQADATIANVATPSIHRDLGASGAAFEMAKVRIAYGGVVVCDGGVEVLHDRERVATHMAGSEIAITCDLRIGPFSASVLTTDLGHAYIDENMRTS